MEPEPVKKTYRKIQLFYFRNSYGLDTLKETMKYGVIIILMSILCGGSTALGIWIVIKTLKAFELF